MQWYLQKQLSTLSEKNVLEKSSLKALDKIVLRVIWFISRNFSNVKKCNFFKRQLKQSDARAREKGGEIQVVTVT